MSCDKEILRKKFLKIRNSISLEKRKRDSELIFSAVRNSDTYKKASVVFAYASFGSEVETKGFIIDALRDGKRIAVPLCNIEEKTMCAVLIKSIDELKKGAFGISEPVNRKNIVKPDDINMVIMPALSFDRYGARLGYGGGYYDRYLKDYMGYKVGVTFFECMADKLPCKEYDIKADAVVFAEEGTVKWQQNI